MLDWNASHGARWVEIALIGDRRRHPRQPDPGVKGLTVPTGAGPIGRC